MPREASNGRVWVGPTCDLLCYDTPRQANWTRKLNGGCGALEEAGTCRPAPEGRVYVLIEAAARYFQSPFAYRHFNKGNAITDLTTKIANVFRGRQTGFDFDLAPIPEQVVIVNAGAAHHTGA